MNRIQFCLSLLAAGFCLAFLSASSTCSTEPSWNPAEVRSVVSTQSTNPPVRRSVYPATSSTLSRWQGPRISRAVGTNRSGTTEPRGARISLVSLTPTSSTLQSCEDGPDIYYPPSWTSVNSSNGSGRSLNNVQHLYIYTGSTTIVRLETTVLAPRSFARRAQTGTARSAHHTGLTARRTSETKEVRRFAACTETLSTLS